MYPRKFEYVAPQSLSDALDALASRSDAKVMSGGMSLIPLMKTRLMSPGLVVDIGGIEGLDTIEDTGDRISIGALVRHGDTAANAAISADAAALAQAAAWTGDVQVRNRGTTCGSMAHADLAADQPAAAVALGATMVVQSQSGTREISAEDFFVDALTTALDPGEILIRIEVPKGGRSAYDKLGRRGGHTDYAVAGAAAWVDKPNGTVENARVAVTGVGTRPTLAAGVVEAIIGTDG